MEMSKREYAEMIVNLINESEDFEGVRAEAREVSKPNGVKLIGIALTEEGCNASPTIYVDEMYDRDVNVEDAVEDVMRAYYKGKLTGNINFDWLMDYEKVKDKLVACLYNASNAEAFPVNRTAKRYGFEDLIITARIKVNLPTGQGSVLVKPDFLEKWGVTKSVVIDQALRNVSKDFIIKSMGAIMAEMMGASLEDLGLPEDDGLMYVVTNREKVYGAIAVIAARKELAKKFPDGYSVIPSSIHEVIIVPSTDEVDSLSSMVGEVNATEVDPTEVLGHKAYLFNGEGVE